MSCGNVLLSLSFHVNKLIKKKKANKEMLYNGDVMNSNVSKTTVLEINR